MIYFGWQKGSAVHVRGFALEKNSASRSAGKWGFHSGEGIIND